MRPDSESRNIGCLWYAAAGAYVLDGNSDSFQTAGGESGPLQPGSVHKTQNRANEEFSLPAVIGPNELAPGWLRQCRSNAIRATSKSIRASSPISVNMISSLVNGVFAALVNFPSARLRTPSSLWNSISKRLHSGQFMQSGGRRKICKS